MPTGSLIHHLFDLGTTRLCKGMVRSADGGDLRRRRQHQLLILAGNEVFRGGL